MNQIIDPLDDLFEGQRDLWVGLSVTTLEILRSVALLTRTVQALRGKSASKVSAQVADLSRKALALKQTIQDTDRTVTSYQHLYHIMKPVKSDPDMPPEDPNQDWGWPDEPPPLPPAPNPRRRQPFESLIDRLS